MDTVAIPKDILNKILLDVEVLIDDVELALDKKIRQRVLDIEENKIKGKSEEELDAYLQKRGVNIE